MLADVCISGLNEVDALKPDQNEVKSYVGRLVKPFERKVA